uniref:Uncharacterized protein n=1 Tax=Ditylenchus dipsaci TaxID=166011 RepID=A0A915EA81_9BILA
MWLEPRKHTRSARIGPRTPEWDPNHQDEAQTTWAHQNHQDLAQTTKRRPKAYRHIQTTWIGPRPPEWG